MVFALENGVIGPVWCQFLASLQIQLHGPVWLQDPTVKYSPKVRSTWDTHEM